MNDDHAIDIRVSAGLSIYPVHGTDSVPLTNHLDAAMYRVKHMSRALT